MADKTTWHKCTDVMPSRCEDVLVSGWRQDTLGGRRWYMVLAYDGVGWQTLDDGTGEPWGGYEPTHWRWLDDSEIPNQ